MIKYIRLIEGDALVAEVEEKENSYIFKKPFQITVDRSNPDRIGMYILPWLPIHSSDDKEVEINKIHVLYMVNVLDELQKKFSEYQSQMYNNENFIKSEDKFKSLEDTESSCSSTPITMKEDEKENEKHLTQLLSEFSIGKKPN